jgi:hypothetical protein
MKAKFKTSAIIGLAASLSLATVVGVGVTSQVVHTGVIGAKSIGKTVYTDLVRKEETEYKPARSGVLGQGTFKNDV